MKKRIISMILLLTITISSIYIPEKVYANDILSDELISHFVNIFYPSEKILAQEVTAILKGEEEGTIEAITSIYKKGATIFGVINQPDLFSGVDVMNKIGTLTNFVSGVLAVYDNAPSLFSNDNSLKKVVNGIQTIDGILSAFGQSWIIPTNIKAACYAIELGFSIGTILEESYLLEALSHYEGELLIAYSLGEELPYKEAPNTLLMSQEKANSIYAAKYMEYMIKQLSNKSNSNIGSTTPTSYTITFESNCSDVEDVSYTFYTDQKNWYVPTMTREGYVFAGWYADAGCTQSAAGTIVIDGNKHFYAKWVKRYHKITYDSNCTEVDDYSYTYDILEDNWKDYTPNRREEYKFMGWYWDATCTDLASGDTITVNRDLTLYAKWERCVFNLTFVSNCDYIDDVLLKYDTRNTDGYTVPTLERPGYLFMGWYKNKACTDKISGSLTIDKDMTFYAKWEKQYNYTVENGKATITGLIGFAVVDNVTITDLTLPSTIDQYPVTKIADSAFEGNQKITSVTVPNSIISIGEKAFAECTSLTSVKLGNNLTTIGESAFSDSGLISVTIPDSVTNLGIRIFESCNNLKSVSIGNGISSIPRETFNWCNSLKTITLPDNITEIGFEAFAICSNLESIYLGKNTTKIDDLAFDGCSSLTQIDIPATVTEIGYGPFAGCTSLKTINVDNQNQNYMFDDDILFTKDKSRVVQCLTSKSGAYIIPDSVTAIGQNAFEGCKNITDLTIGKNVTNIGREAFSRCIGLTDLHIPGNVKAIGLMAFAYCANIENIAMDNGVNSIMPNAFLQCNSLVNVKLSNSLTYLNGAFINCPKLERVIMPSKAKNLFQAEFSYCDSLKSIIIPGTVTNIVSNAFNGSDNLTDFYYEKDEASWEKITGHENVSGTIHFDYVPRTITTTTINGSNIDLSIDIPAIDMPDNSKLIIAGYGGDSLKEIKIINIDWKTANVKESISALEIDSFKITIWNNLTDITPLTTTEEFAIFEY